MWDNVPHDEVAALCAKHDGDAETCAEAIATLAFTHSCDPSYDSPFTQEARKAAEDTPAWEDTKNLVGGKMDDIAVVVAYFEKEQVLRVPPPKVSPSKQLFSNKLFVKEHLDQSI